MQIDGACHCGAITFSAEIDPSRVLLCHCTDCQVLSGSPFRHVALADSSHFSLQGVPTQYVKVSESGNRRIQAFCPSCGTPIYSSAQENPGWYSIRLGAVRQRAALKPSAQTWHRSAQPWLDELPAVPRSPTQEALHPLVPR